MVWIWLTGISLGGPVDALLQFHRHRGGADDPSGKGIFVVLTVSIARLTPPSARLATAAQTNQRVLTAVS